MKVIITGGSGFIGRNIILNAHKDWEIIALYNNDESFIDFLADNKLNNVTPVGCNLLNRYDVELLSKKIGKEFDLCLYFAAKVNIPASVNNPVEDLEYNTISLINFLQVFIINKFIFMSSGAVYDNLIGSVNPGVTLNPTLPYAISKLSSEQYVKFYCQKRHSIDNYINIRFYGAYGPYEPKHKIYTKLLKSLYFEGKNEFEIYGDGRNLINAMYVDDAISGILNIVNSKNTNLTVDFVGKEPMSIKQLVREIAVILGKEHIIIKTNGISNEYIEFFSSPRMMQELFDFTPSIPLREGVMRYLDFMIKHLDSYRL